MRQVREVLRLKYELGVATVACPAGRSPGPAGVSEYCRRAVQAGLTWPVPGDMDDGQLEALFQRIGDLVAARCPTYP